MKTILIMELLCCVGMLLPCAIAQPSDADRRELAQLRAKAEAGDAQSQFELGAAFSIGKFGVATNYVEAVKWYRKAAEQNHAAAQSNLGACYGTGQGVEKDVAEAARWYRKAAEQNDPVAQYNLGGCYAIGQGVTKDYMDSASWLRKAAEQNHAKAQSDLGVCYLAGLGVTKDYV
jgi:uncharacterized protein